MRAEIFMTVLFKIVYGWIFFQPTTQPTECGVLYTSDPQDLFDPVDTRRPPFNLL